MLLSLLPFFSYHGAVEIEASPNAEILHSGYFVEAFPSFLLAPGETAQSFLADLFPHDLTSHSL